MTDVEWLDIFGDNLASMLKESGMSQYALAEVSGVSEGTISKYIHKRQMPTVMTIIRLAYALGCAPSELIDFE